MDIFFETHKQDFINSIIVVVAVLSLRLLTTIILNWILKIQVKKFPDQNHNAPVILKKVLNVLWVILGLMSIKYIFSEQNDLHAISQKFKIIIYIGIVLSVTIVSASSVNIWFGVNINKKQKADQDSTSFKFLRYVVVTSISFLGLVLCLLAFPSLKGIAQTALGGAGVLAIITGLAAQEALANIIGGIFIIVFKPFRIGDVIEISSTETGVVHDITLRHTVIKNYKNRMVVIPNSVINKERVVNYDLGDEKTCEYIEVDITYESDVSKAKLIMQEECEKHKLIFDIRTDNDKKEGFPIVQTSLISLNDSSVTIRAWAWTKNYGEALILKREVLESVKKRFENEGVDFAYPHSMIIIKRD